MEREQGARKVRSCWSCGWFFTSESKNHISGENLEKINYVAGPGTPIVK